MVRSVQALLISHQPCHGAASTIGTLIALQQMVARIAQRCWISRSFPCVAGDSAMK